MIPTLKTNHKDYSGLYNNDVEKAVGKYAEKSTGWIMHVKSVVILDGAYHYLCQASNVHVPFVQTVGELKDEYIRLHGE